MKKNKAKFLYPMSDSEYVEVAGAVCPFCRSPEIEGVGGVDIDGAYVFNPMVCLSCGETWSDRYRLDGYGGVQDVENQT